MLNAVAFTALRLPLWVWKFNSCKISTRGKFIMNITGSNEMPIKKYELAGFYVEEFLSLDSTNSYLKRCSNCIQGQAAAIAYEQTAGRGRLGRSFFSSGGLYMSLMLRGVAVRYAHLLTPCSAVIVARAIEKLGAHHAGIKWVNDIYIDEKKVCGILCETKPKGAALDYAIVGIGVNLKEPKGGFPKEIKNLAGAAFNDPPEELRGKLASEIINSFSEIEAVLSSRKFIDEYRERSILIGRNIEIVSDDKIIPARVLGIDDECRLIAETAGGTRKIFTGEVSLRL